MKTLKGFDAIDLADRYNIPLLDLETKKEISAERAMVQIHQRHDPSIFVIQNWPDSDEEAEAVILKEFQKALRENRWAEASLLAINASLNGSMPIHLRAAELAAERLVKQGKLELVEMGKDFSLYRIPRTVRFSEEFLKELRGIVCEECAILDVEGPFHETCLMNLFDYLQEKNFTVHDIIQVEEDHHPETRFRMSRPNIGMQWLSRTASATKSRLKSVVQPILSQDSDGLHNKAKKPDEKPVSQVSSDEHVQYRQQPSDSDESVQVSRTVAPTTAWTETSQKQRISKQELISYMQSVEIVEDPYEIDSLKNENAELQRLLREKKQDYEKVEKQRVFFEKQCQELQRDLDVLVQAMQIAKRRDSKSDNIVDVVDATYTE